MVKRIIEDHRRAAVWIIFVMIIMMLITWVIFPWSFVICFIIGGVIAMLMFLYQFSEAIVRGIIKK